MSGRRRFFYHPGCFYGLDGMAYKSKGEADIANWLLLNGIPYSYEDPYIVDTRNEKYRGQYHPDFHIPDTDVYIEYYGINRKGKVAPYFTSKTGRDPSIEYREGMEWKRQVHKENGTRLVELYSYQRSNGTLEKKLRRQLARRGVKRAPLMERMRIRRKIKTNLRREEE